MFLAFVALASFSYHITILIHLFHLQAMSSDSGDFDFAAPVCLHAAGGEGAGDDAFDFAPAAAPSADNSGSDTGFDFAAPIIQDGPPRRRRRRAPETSGVFWTVATTKDPDTAASTHIVQGLVEMQWEVNCEGRNLDSGVGGGVCGSLIYSIRRCAMLNEPARLPNDFDIARRLASLHALSAIGNVTAQGSGGVTVSRFLVLQQARVEHELLVCAASEATFLGTAAGPGPHRFRQVPIYRRWADRSRLIASLPKSGVLKRWRKEARRGVFPESDSSQDQDMVAPASFDPMTYIPPKYAEQASTPSLHRPDRIGKEVDPVRLIHALSVLLHLRSPTYFVEAMDDAYDYIFMDEDRGPRDNREDPSRTSLRRSLARADLVSMSITRRMVVAMNISSDASPVVGVELQGMLVDVVLEDDSVTRLILPGSTLAYGHTGTVSKGLALLWAVWLIAGPETKELQWFCSHVRSLTTDFGVEMHLLDLPDMSAAMVAWAGGRALHRVRPLVQPDTRLFPRALRIAGWSHTMGGVMKGVAELFPQWPSSLSNMRFLCKFYKNGTYRQHIRRKMALERALDKSLASFTAGFAKWRYETVYEVLRQLDGVRAVSELPLPPQLFAHAQDQAEMAQVMAACRDAPFWRWTSVSFKTVFRELEFLRRWGMVCECPDHREERHRSGGKKIIKCPRNALPLPDLSLLLSRLEFPYRF